jgi:hemoglobin
VELKKSLIEYLSSATGGPILYKGKSMKETHRGMGITKVEFEAMIQTLDKALKKNNVKPIDANDLVRIVNSTRKDIVEEKADDKKPGGGKPEEKKSDDKSKDK